MKFDYSDGGGMFNRNGGDDREELHQWMIMDTWTHEAAMWLIAGVIPARIYEGFGFFRVEGGLLNRERGEREEAVTVIQNLERLWRSNPAHPDTAPPSVYFQWAHKKGIPIPWLEEARKAGYFAVADLTPIMPTPASVQPTAKADAAISESEGSMKGMQMATSSGGERIAIVLPDTDLINLASLPALMVDTLLRWEHEREGFPKPTRPTPRVTLFDRDKLLAFIEGGAHSA